MRESGRGEAGIETRGDYGGSAGGVNGERAPRRPDLRPPRPLPLDVLHELPVDPPHLGVWVVIRKTAGNPVGDPVGFPNVGSEGAVRLHRRLPFHLPHPAPDLVG